MSFSEKRDRSAPHTAQVRLPDIRNRRVREPPSAPLRTSYAPVHSGAYGFDNGHSNLSVTTTSTSIDHSEGPFSSQPHSANPRFTSYGYDDDSEATSHSQWAAEDSMEPASARHHTPPIARGRRGSFLDRVSTDLSKMPLNSAVAAQATGAAGAGANLNWTPGRQTPATGPNPLSSPPRPMTSSGKPHRKSLPSSNSHPSDLTQFAFAQPPLALPAGAGAVPIAIGLPNTARPAGYSQPYPQQQTLHQVPYQPQHPQQQPYGATLGAPFQVIGASSPASAGTTSSSGGGSAAPWDDRSFVPPSQLTLAPLQTFKNVSPNLGPVPSHAGPALGQNRLKHRNGSFGSTPESPVEPSVLVRSKSDGAPNLPPRVAVQPAPVDCLEVMSTDAWSSLMFQLKHAGEEPRALAGTPVLPGSTSQINASQQSNVSQSGSGSGGSGRSGSSASSLLSQQSTRLTPSNAGAAAVGAPAYERSALPRQTAFSPVPEVTSPEEYPSDSACSGDLGSSDLRTRSTTSDQQSPTEHAAARAMNARLLLQQTSQLSSSVLQRQPSQQGGASESAPWHSHHQQHARAASFTGFESTSPTFLQPRLPLSILGHVAAQRSVEDSVSKAQQSQWHASQAKLASPYPHLGLPAAVYGIGTINAASTASRLSPASTSTPGTGDSSDNESSQNHVLRHVRIDSAPMSELSVARAASGSIPPSSGTLGELAHSGGSVSSGRRVAASPLSRPSDD